MYIIEVEKSLSKWRRLSWVRGLIVLVACAPPHPTPLRSPHIVGTATLERIEGHTYLLSLVMRKAPPPQTFADGASAFVLWLQTFKMGALTPPEFAGVLSYDATAGAANLMVTTPHPRVLMTVRAQTLPTPEQPAAYAGGQIVVRQIAEAQ